MRLARSNSVRLTRRALAPISVLRSAGKEASRRTAEASPLASPALHVIPEPERLTTSAPSPFSAPTIGIPAASLVFGLLHGPSRGLWPLAVWAAGAGAILGVIFSATGSLLLPTLVHAFYDAAALIYVRYYWRPREIPKET